MESPSSAEAALTSRQSASPIYDPYAAARAGRRRATGSAQGQGHGPRAAAAEKTVAIRRSAVALVGLALLVLLVIGAGTLLGRAYPVSTARAAGAERGGRSPRVPGAAGTGTVQQRVPATPPGVVFGVVWPILYALIAVSLWLVATRVPMSSQQQAARITALVLLLAQLAANYAWMPVYRGGAGARPALYVLLGTLALSVTGTFAAAGSGAWGAAVALGPYLAWLIFALMLNAGEVNADAHGGGQKPKTH